MFISGEKDHTSKNSALMDALNELLLVRKEVLTNNYSF